jgi:hypothetical protein
MSEFTQLHEMVKEMLNAEDKGFNDWEIEFLDDMYKRSTYSENMINKIEQIYKKKM